MELDYAETYLNLLPTLCCGEEISFFSESLLGGTTAYYTP